MIRSTHIWVFLKTKLFFSGVRPFFHIFHTQTDFTVTKLELLENLENLKLCVSTGDCNVFLRGGADKKKDGSALVLWGTATASPLSPHCLGYNRDVIPTSDKSKFSN